MTCSRFRTGKRRKGDDHPDLSHGARVGAGALSSCRFDSGSALLGDPSVLRAGNFTFRRVKPPEAGTTQAHHHPDRKNLALRDGSTGGPQDSANGSRGRPGAGRQDRGMVLVDNVSLRSRALQMPRASAKPCGFSTANPVRKGGRMTWTPEGPRRRSCRHYGAEVLLATAGRKISPALVISVIAVESSGSPLRPQFRRARKG